VSALTGDGPQRLCPSQTAGRGEPRRPAGRHADPKTQVSPLRFGSGGDRAVTDPFVLEQRRERGVVGVGPRVVGLHPPRPDAQLGVEGQRGVDPAWWTPERLGRKALGRKDVWMPRTRPPYPPESASSGRRGCSGKRRVFGPGRTDRHGGPAVLHDSHRVSRPSSASGGSVAGEAADADGAPADSRLKRSSGFADRCMRLIGRPRSRRASTRGFLGVPRAATRFRTAGHAAGGRRRRRRSINDGELRAARPRARGNGRREHPARRRRPMTFRRLVVRTPCARPASP